MLIPNEYEAMHNCVGQLLYWKIPYRYGINTADNWYEHHPDPAVQGDNAIILWYFSVDIVPIMWHNYLL